MKSIRRVHSWLGVLFAPSIILFALSGMLQMFGCHEGEGGSAPNGVVVRLAQLHMKQTVALPRKRPPRPAGAAPGAAPTERGPAAGPEGARPGPGPEGVRAPAEQPTTLPLRVFFLAMSLGLIATSLLGLYVAFTSKRDRRLLVGLLVAGTVVPIALMLL